MNMIKIQDSCKRIRMGMGNQFRERKGGTGVLQTELPIEKKRKENAIRRERGGRGFTSTMAPAASVRVGEMSSKSRLPATHHSISSNIIPKRLKKKGYEK